MNVIQDALRVGGVIVFDAVSNDVGHKPFENELI